MAIYYVDPAAGGANDGSSWTDAWTAVQTAFDTATAGDTVYCRGTETLAAIVDIDQQAGDTTSGHIKFIGCDAAGTARAGQFTLDGDSTAANCLKVTGARNRYWIENFTLKNATGDNLNGIGDATNKDHWVMKSCIFESAGSDGAYTRYMRYIQFEQCIFRNNGAHGLYERGSHARLRFCTFHGNAGSGLYMKGSGARVWSCLAYDNTAAGFYVDEYMVVAITNSTSDDNADGIYIAANVQGAALIANRLTNNSSYGIDQTGAVSQANIEDWCVFYNNGGGSDHRRNIVAGGNSLTAADATGCGYIDATNRNYGLTNQAVGRRIKVEL